MATTESTENTARLDLGSPAILDDPHAAHRRAFRSGPIVRSPDPADRTWYVGHHADVSALLRDPRLSADRVAFLAHRLPPPHRQAIEPLLGALGKWLLFMDPPRHTPLRRSINAALSRRLVLRMRPQIDQLVTQLLDGIASAERIDVVRDLAYPLPATVIARMLGARLEDTDRLRDWSNDIARFLGLRTTFAMVRSAQDAMLAMLAYFRDVLARHRADPRDDLMGALIAASAGMGDDDDEVLLANCVAMMFAGHETTTNLIGNAVHLLLDRPEVVARLRRDPSAWDPAIEEVLRYESPVLRVSRVTTTEIEVAGITIPAGHRIILVLSAANRDPAVFDDPDRFDIDRHPIPHLSFGFGIHLCSGIALARAEARATLQTLFERFDDLQREGPVRWKPNFGLRSLEALPISFRSARAGGGSGEQPVDPRPALDRS